MNTAKFPGFWRASGAGLFLIALLQALPAAAEDSVWVRIHHPATDGALERSIHRSSLEDYGSFMWGSITTAEREQLERLGVRLTAQENPFLINLGGGRVDLTEISAANIEESAHPEGDWHLVQFNGPVRPQWLETLASSGVRIAQAIHPFAYFVWADRSQAQAMAASPRIRGTGRLQPLWKVQPHLRNFDSEIRPTMALASAHVDQGRLAAELAELGRVHAITPFTTHFNIVHMDLAGNRYERLASIPAIFTVQYIRPEVGPRGEMSNQSIVGNIDDDGNVFPGYLDWLFDTGYTGNGITVGVVDGGIRVSHVDLADRITPCIPSGETPTSCTNVNDAHGTHVAGAVAGTGASGELLNGFLRGQGVAPDARMIQQGYDPFTGAGSGGMIPDGMLKIYRESAISGALLTNNSWGPTSVPQGYDIPTAQIDMISRDADPATPGDQPVLAVWSIMNGDGDSPIFGPDVCNGSSLGSPDEAKNLFAVGSTALQSNSGAQLGNIFRISGNSAHGLACDGRQVPHIVAPGCNTDSTSSFSDTSHSAGFCGTSMASPVVSGAVAIWSERYIEQTGSNPSPALTKAVFTAAARDLAGNPNADGGIMGHRPNRFQGFGRLDLDQIMNHPSPVFLIDQETVFNSVGQEWRAPFVAADPSQPIRIMLAWTDAPGPAQGIGVDAWQNNLDLIVEAQGQTFLGNVIGSDGWSATGGVSDPRNNLEGVFLAPSQHDGSLTITVSASDLPADALQPRNPGLPTQDFALACYNCIEGEPGFELSVVPGQTQICLPANGTESFTAEARVEAVGDYQGSVSFEASGLPAKVFSAFVPDQIAVPGSADWTLEADATAAPGTYPVELIGDDGNEQKSASFGLTLLDTLVTAPILSEPTNGAADLVLDPVFSWQAVEGADAYRFQLALDPTFSNVLGDITTDQTRLASDFGLELQTVYYWRVRATNACGSAQWSDPFTFTTRLEPVASLSASTLSFVVDTNDQADDELIVENTGTGNLTFDIQSDLLASAGAGNRRGTIDPDLDEVLDVPDFSVTGSEQGSPLVTFEQPAGLTSSGIVVGFSFEGTVAGVGSGSSWASDLRLVITSPDGSSFDVGGFETTINDWDFQGSVSNEDGTYSSNHVSAFGGEGTLDSGLWTLSFRHGWESDSAGTMDWSDVTITLHKLPLPQCQEDRSNVSWLSTDPVNGSVAADDSLAVTVSVDSAELIPGAYLGYLCIDTNDPMARPAIVEVEMLVEGDPISIAEVSPGAFDLTLVNDEVATETMEIGNRGNAELVWSISTALPIAPGGAGIGETTGPGAGACSEPAAVSWLEVAPLSGNVAAGPESLADHVDVSIDASQLDVGIHEAVLCIETNDPAKPLIELPVSLDVRDDPVFEDRFEGE